MNFVSTSYTATKREMMKYTLNGEDKLDEVDQEFIEIDLETRKGFYRVQCCQ